MTDLSPLFERPADGRPIVWLLSVPFRDKISPDALAPYGYVRTIFSNREQAWHSPDLVMHRLLEPFVKAWRPEDFIAWQGGDSLLLVFLGLALANAGIDRFQWLRYIGFDSYQVVVLSPFEFAPTPTP